MDFNKSLEEIDGENWGDPDKGATGLIRKCLALRRKPLKDFSNDDLTRMILQNKSLNYLVPIAMKRLVENPLNSGNYYRGDLLCSVLKVKKNFWKENPELQEEFDGIVLDVVLAYETIVPLIKVYQDTNNLK
ncbi:contact-dependent growth inhibition system immunity protein [Paenibacillus sp. MAH-36]|uniref:Contact-dependent growth inhibition system immunity protein n=2 Tax=Paenibacillus TaxID=44249 RepID=A0ABU3RQD5_9BACL|nr:contact-dependent growth inhibition system immunity protein [Paenibacillus sp. PFR10]MDU0206384.1 contact-dependent growth inhibition system immunity protein [Paenibacillus sp. PFR10]